MWTAGFRCEEFREGSEAFLGDSVDSRQLCVRGAEPQKERFWGIVWTAGDYRVTALLHEDESFWGIVWTAGPRPYEPPDRPPPVFGG